MVALEQAYGASLELRKLHQVLPDHSAVKHRQLPSINLDKSSPKGNGPRLFI